MMTVPTLIWKCCLSLSKWFVVITNLLMVAMCVLMLILISDLLPCFSFALLWRGMQVVFSNVD